MNAPDRHGERDRDENVCGPCRLGEHVYCDGNVDLPAPVTGGVAVPLLRCACGHRRNGSRKG